MQLRKLLAVCLLLGSCFLGSAAFAQSGDIKAQLQQADQYREEKSYHMAISIYESLLNQPDLTGKSQREISFKWADSSWRSKETQRYEKAVKMLKEIAESKESDRWRAEAGESLAEHYLEIDRWSHAEEIRRYLQTAREFWAGSKDIDLARLRFIKASFTLGDFIQNNWGWSYQALQPAGLLKRKILPEEKAHPGLDILYEEILQVAKSDQDKARAYYSLAMSCYNQYYSQDKKGQAVKYFEKVIQEYSAGEWTDDAYYYLGQYYEQSNDFPKALAAYQGLVKRFGVGQSQWGDEAGLRIKDITSPQLGVTAGYTFLPDSDIQFSLNWRNVDHAQMALYRIDLAKELTLDFSKAEGDSLRGVNNYTEMLKRIVDAGRHNAFPVLRSWQILLKDDKDYKWQNATKGLAEWQKKDDKEEADLKKGKLEPGAYLLLVSSAAAQAYELILVTDMGLVTKTAEKSALFFAFDAKSGAPRANVNVAYQYRYYTDEGQWAWAEGRGVTDASGLLPAALKNARGYNSNRQHQLLACVSDGTMQAFAQGNYYAYNNQPGQWRLYATSDRPAYRPGETVSFKATLRQYNDQAFQTPSGKIVQARIYDARGNKVKEQKYILNNFGSFNDTLTLDENAVLGEYRIDVYSQDWNVNLGQTPLFRLEEYKLPEFLVNIQPRPKEGETSSTYQLGDVVDVELDAQYYFGGPVAGAQVEYLIYLNNYTHDYNPPRKYPWYYEDMRSSYNNYYDGGALIKKETIKTDAQGKAVFRFETPQDMNQDLNYRVEARVVDQSRREITASSQIKVTRQAFYAYLTPKQNLYRPGDKVEVDIKILTANDDPVAIDGQITVARNWWKDPIVALGAQKDQNEKVTAVPGHYDENVLFTKFVKTDNKGEAVFAFEAQQDGYYVVQFKGYDAKGREVTSQANVFVCATQSKDLGYRYGGIQIIPEKDTYRIGETARVMLIAEKPDTWTLLSTQTDEILDYHLYRMEGNVKLVEFAVTEVLTPNVFLNALSAENYQLKTHDIQLIVPPDEKFLNVKIVSDKEIYRPGEKGTFEVAVTDKQGRPVTGEVSLGLVDASVYYIQSDYAQDIRQFFYGTKRQNSVQTQASFYQRPYQRIDLGLQDQKKVVSDEAGEAGGKDGTIRGNFRGEYEGRRDAAFYSDSDSPLSVAAGAPIAVKRELNEKLRNFKSAGIVGNKQLASLPVSGPMVRIPSDAELVTPQVRSDFRSTVVWQPSLVTDAQGKAAVNVTFPDSLTTWRATARSLTTDTLVGNVTQETKTNKDIMVRLQAPRFFTERDHVTISANVHNHTDKEQKVKVTINADGLAMTGKEEIWVTVPAQGEHRVNWATRAEHQGTAKITVMAQTDMDSDAMVKSYPIIPHGIEKFIAAAVALKGKAEGTSAQEFTLTLPKERIPESTSLRLVLSPSLAAAMLDALPYLADYPYGCVEQTMSRFLPAVIVKKTMKDLKLSETMINQYISDVLEPRGDPQHPQRGSGNTLAKLDEMTKSGLERLYDFQHADGGWGWWKEGDSDRFMSAYVVWGLAMAREAGIDVKRDVLSRAVSYLRKELVQEENNPDMLAWMLHALAKSYGGIPSVVLETTQIERLWQMRDQLNPYTRALFALTEFYIQDGDRLQILARNLTNGMIEDKENGTVHWGEAGVNYHWSEGGVEATAFVIKALSLIDPHNENLEPAVKWLSLNRRGARWKNTRDTAIAILGLSDYLKTTDELTPDFDYEISVNGKSIQKGHVDRLNLFTFNRNIELPNEALRDGNNVVEVSVKGKGSLYTSGYLKYFTLEENITPAGNEVFVGRKYYIQDESKTLLKGYTSDWRPLADGDKVKSGDRIRVEIILEAKNNYEYLVVEDYKPAGLEATELTSGSGTADFLGPNGQEAKGSTWLYKEYRDQKAAFFIDKLKQGQHRIRYEVRAEVPGEFHGMPNQTHAMYVPEIRANSSEMRIVVEDRGQE